MNKSESLAELAVALAKAQGEIENASKTSANPHFKSKYADLAEILNTVRPVFSAHGLSVVQCPSFEAGIVSVETVLLHSSGQWISSVISTPVGKQDAQGVGSAITYCRRYALAATCGVAQEDDDATAAVGSAPARQQFRPAVSAIKFNMVDLVADIAKSSDMARLKTAYEAACDAVRGDSDSLAKIVAAKDKRKAELTPELEQAE